MKSWSDQGSTISQHRPGGREKEREGVRVRGMETSFMTVREVATYLRLKPLAIYRMVKAKDIPFKRANRSLRFEKEEIDQWMKWGRR